MLSTHQNKNNHNNNNIEFHSQKFIYKYICIFKLTYEHFTCPLLK